MDQTAAPPEPHEPSEIPVSYLLRDLDAFAKAGVAVHPVLRAAGIDPDQLDPNGSIGLDRYLRLIDRLLAEPGTRGVGLATGISETIKDHGILGYTMLSCGSLIDAIRIWLRYYALFHWPLGGAFSNSETEATLEVVEPELRPYNDRQRVFMIEMWMANWAAAFHDFFGAEHCFLEVQLAYPDPGYAQRYCEILGAPVSFGRKSSQIRFPASYLNRLIIGGNESVRKFCEQQCAQFLAEMTVTDGLIDRMRWILLRRAGQFPGMEQVADQLHMSERSLRRKLDALGTSYKDVLDDVRMRLAGEYLKGSRMKTQQVSELLGYSEVAAFNRAFKRWYGVPPSSYREGSRDERASKTAQRAAPL